MTTVSKLQCELTARPGAPRVALLQSSIGYDGRSQTLARVIHLLNERDVMPTLLTFASRADCAQMEENVRNDLRYALACLPCPRFVVGHQFKELAIPRVASHRLADFDVVFANNTSVYGFSPRQAVLRQICFPLEHVARYEKRYERLSLRVYALAERLLTAWSRRRFIPHGVWLANSRFTATEMQEAYGLRAEDIKVVYPPVDFELAPGGVRDSLVVSVGGFHEDKRQLEQIELAARMPDIQFAIIGSSRSRLYFKKCRHAAGRLGNVELVPDATAADRVRLLARARVFLHSKRFEHFGMSTVEGVAHGCIPIVHDSGGQREVVPYDDLRFRDAADAEALIRAAIAGDFDSMLPDLHRHISAFNTAAFDQRMEPILDAALGSATVR